MDRPSANTSTTANNAERSPMPVKVKRATVWLDNSTVDLIRDIRVREKRSHPDLRMRFDLTNSQIVERALQHYRVAVLKYE